MGGQMGRRKEKRRFYAFVDAAVEPLPDNPYSRETLLLDCVDADAFDQGEHALDEDESLSLIRVTSTRRRLEEDYGLRKVQESEWLELTIDDEGGAPRAWVMPASANYASEAGSSVRSIAKLPDGDGGGAAAAVTAKLSKGCALEKKRYGDAAADFLAALHLSLGSRLEIRAVDVGHASCNVFIYEGKPVGYFDVGAPLYRNQKSFGGSLCHAVPSNGFVLLSHWDFDHFDLARRRPELQKFHWLAPDQPVGPNALKFQKSLGSNLRFFPGPIIYSAMELRPGTSTNPKDRNGTGYSMRIEIDGEVIVLTGDCSYDKLDPAGLVDATVVTIPHHGGKSDTSPPQPRGNALAVASYGNPNCYRHPCEDHLDEHRALGWTIQRTAAHSSNGSSRGSRTLYSC